MFHPLHLKQIIADLEVKFPDTHPAYEVPPFDLGYRAGAIEIIRRLKEYNKEPIDG